MRESFITKETFSVSQLPWLSFLLLCLAYALVGWDLAGGHVIWFVSIFIIALAMATSWVANEWIGRILGYIPIVLLIAASISLFITLVVISASFLMLVLIPFLTTFFAWQEMRFWNFSKTSTFWVLLCVALFGLGLGEFLDLLVLPSSRH